MPLPPFATVDPALQGFGDMETAARMVLESASEKNAYREYGGAIYERDGLYYHSIPVKGKAENFIFAVDPKAGKLVAIFHTHPGDGVPSKDDIAMANKLKVASYVRGKYKDVWRYNPGEKQGVKLEKK
jgi:hypothetical protein